MKTLYKLLIYNLCTIIWKGLFWIGFMNHQLQLSVHPPQEGILRTIWATITVHNYYATE